MLKFIKNVWSDWIFYWNDRLTLYLYNIIIIFIYIYMIIFIFIIIIFMFIDLYNLVVINIVQPVITEQDRWNVYTALIVKLTSEGGKNIDMELITERIKAIWIFKINNPNVSLEEYLDKHALLTANNKKQVMEFVNNVNNLSLYKKWEHLIIPVKSHIKVGDKVSHIILSRTKF